MDVTTGKEHCSKGATLDAANNALLVSREAQLNLIIGEYVTIYDLIVAM